MRPVSIRCIIAVLCIVLMSISAGCIDLQGGVKTNDLFPHNETAAGYDIGYPGGWSARLVNNSWLSVTAPDGKSDLLIWPMYFNGQSNSTTAVDLADYAVGNIKKQVTGFNILSIRKSDNDDFVEIVANYTMDGAKYKGVFTTSTSGRSGLVAGYEAVETGFYDREKVMRSIIASYKPVIPQAGSRVKTLHSVTPETVPNPDFPYFVGAFTMSIPDDWNATQRQVDMATVNWMAGTGDYNTHVFSINKYTAFTSQQQKDYWVDLLRIGNQKMADLYLTYPAISDTSARSFVLDWLPQAGFFQGTENITDVRIVESYTVPDAYRKALLGSNTGDAGYYMITFTRNGVPVRAKILVTTSRIAGNDWQWFASVQGYSAPDSEFNDIEPTLQAVIGSIKPTALWLNHIADLGGVYRDTPAAVFNDHLDVKDRVITQWSDTILNNARIYDAGAGEIFTVPEEFARVFNAGRDELTAADIRDLNAWEYNLVPLDGRL